RRAPPGAVRGPPHRPLRTAGAVAARARRWPAGSGAAARGPGAPAAAHAGRAAAPLMGSASRTMEIAGKDAELPEIRQRARWFAVFVGLIFTALAVRLFYLQVVEGDTYYKVTAD